MKKNYKVIPESAVHFITSNINEKTGVSSVVLEYKKELYKGMAVFNPQDIEDWGVSFSRFFGCQIAESRAYLKILKKELSERKKKYKIIKDFLVGVFNAKAFSSNSPVAKLIYHQLAIEEQKITCLREEIAAIRHNIPELVNLYYNSWAN